MADEKPKKEMTKADAAKLVFRLVPVLDEKNQPKKDKEGNVITKRQEVPEKDVMSFGDYEDRVVVVTTHGEKLVHTK
jgi:hypothetical protein